MAAQLECWNRHGTPRRSTLCGISTKQRLNGRRKHNGVYNLQGQRVGNTTEGLPSGIYIVNGRKHVVR